jgi:hypothetical protein
VGPLEGGPNGLVRGLKVVCSTHLTIMANFRHETKPDVGPYPVFVRRVRSFRGKKGAGREKTISVSAKTPLARKGSRKNLEKPASARLEWSPSATRTCGGSMSYGSMIFHDAFFAMFGIRPKRAPGTATGLVLHAAREYSTGAAEEVALQLL